MSQLPKVDSKYEDEQRKMSKQTSFNEETPGTGAFRDTSGSVDPAKQTFSGAQMNLLSY